MIIQPNKIEVIAVTEKCDLTFYLGFKWFMDNCNIYKDKPKAETPMGIGYVIDFQPTRGWYHIWFGPHNHDWFYQDEVELLTEK